MSEATHTPGPWEIWGDSQVIIRKPNRAGAMVRGTICSVGLSPRQLNHGPRQSYPEALAEQRANAHLIASAPDLLAACEALLRRWPDLPLDAADLLAPQMRAASDAIAKARACT